MKHFYYAPLVLAFLLVATSVANADGGATVIIKGTPVGNQGVGYCTFANTPVNGSTTTVTITYCDPTDNTDNCTPGFCYVCSKITPVGSTTCTMTPDQTYAECEAIAESKCQGSLTGQPIPLG